MKNLAVIQVECGYCCSFTATLALCTKYERCRVVQPFPPKHCCYCTLVPESNVCLYKRPSARSKPSARRWDQSLAVVNPLLSIGAKSPQTIGNRRRRKTSIKSAAHVERAAKTSSRPQLTRSKRAGDSHSWAAFLFKNSRALGTGYTSPRWVFTELGL